MAFVAMTSADKQFLKELDNWCNKTIYAKVVALDFNDLVVEEITGKVTSGSININGTSAVRRTFNLSMVSDINNVKINDFYWGLNTKIKLEIGVKNDINPNYPNIIWFNQGIYFITNFSTSITANSYNISINGKDKMCLLDGTLGGTIPSEVDFGVIDIYDEETNSTITKELKIVDIIKEAVHFYGKEPFHNIIINDLDPHGFYVLKHADEKPLYLFYRYQTGFDEYGVFQKNIEKGIDTSYPIYGEQIESRECYCVGNIQPDSNNQTFVWTKEKICYIQDIPNFKQIGTLNIDGSENGLGTLISFTEPKDAETGMKDFYRVVKVENGQDFGYDVTELTYPDAANGGLKMSAGSTIVALLDKIKQTFGDYEYFYDVNGKFVFQKKRTYINTSWNNIQKDENGEQYIINNSEATSIAYNFEDSNLISSFGLNPNFQELKNDFVVWGEKNSSSGNGNKLPIHMRYVIDQKPEYYHSITVLENEIQDSEKVKQTQIGKSYFTKEFSDKITEEINEKISKDTILVYQKRVEEKIEDISQKKLPKLKNDYEAIAHNYNPITQEVSVKQQQEINKLISDIEELDESCLMLIEDLEYYIGYQFNFSESTNINKMFSDFKTLIYDIKNTFANIKNFEIIITKINELIKKLEQLITSLYPVDWRELIYQMAKDYYAFETLDYFDMKIIKANQRQNTSSSVGFSYYEKGVTGYEQYYQEMIAFWRELYNYFSEPVYSKIGINKDLTNYDQLYVKERYYSLTVNEALALDEKEQEKLITRKNLNDSQDNKDYQLVNYLNSIPIFYSINEEELEKDSEALEKNLYYIKVGENDFQSISSFNGYSKNSLYVSAYEDSDSYEKLVTNNLYTNQTTQPLYLFYNNIYTDPKKEYANSAELLERYYRENQYQGNYNEYQLKKSGEWLKDSDGINIFSTKTNIYYEKKQNYYGYSSQERLRFWNKEVFICPQNLNFWIDFLDSGNDQINRYSVQAIGSRTKVENNSSIQGIYYEEIPNTIFLSDSSYTESLDQITGYEIVRISEATKNLFVKSNNFLSAKEQIDTLLYNYGYCTESISITTIPVYYLEPNTRIRVYDEKANINGEYIITQLTVPLTHNGTMNITATKVAQRLK